MDPASPGGPAHGPFPAVGGSAGSVTPGGPRVLVIGASSGLGRSIGTGLAGRGHRVAFLGRRLDRVEAAAAEAGSGAIALSCDVRDSASCAAAVDLSAKTFGGVDALVYCAGIGPLARLVDTTSGMWREVLDTNLVGAALATRAALPHLAASGGRAVYLSSASAGLTPPWPGLGAYAVSKAALDKMVDAWREEHPEVCFTRVTLGESVGGPGHGATEFASGWDAALTAECFSIWIGRGYLTGGIVPVEELVSAVGHLVGMDAEVPSIAIIPRRPVPIGPS